MASLLETRQLPVPDVPRRDGRIRLSPAAGNPTPEQMNKFRLAAELSQERKREEEFRRYYSDTSIDSPLNQAIAAQKAEANRPFIPTTAAYPLASQNQTSFASPAAAYMRERQLEGEQAARGLLDETSPARVTNFALRTGNEAGDNNRERSFLERMSQSGLLSTLQGMARAERQYGVGPLAAFSESALDVQAARGAAEQEAAETQAKVDIGRLKNQPKPPKLSSEAVKLYDRINTSRASAALVQEMKKALTDGFDTGIIGTSEQAIKAIANAFNIPIGTSGKEDYNKLVAQLKTGMLRSGRLLKADFDLLDQIIPKATTFRNKEQLLNSIRAIEDKANRQLFQDQRLLKTFGLPAASGAMPSTMIRSRNN